MQRNGWIQQFDGTLCMMVGKLRQRPAEHCMAAAGKFLYIFVYVLSTDRPSLHIWQQHYIAAFTVNTVCFILWTTTRRYHLVIVVRYSYGRVQRCCLLALGVHKK
jgi:hypothetical protein